MNASIIDLGFIRWKDDVTNYVNNGGEFNFSGIDMDEFILNEVDSSGDKSFDRVIDSLSEAFELNEETANYTSSLTSRVYVGATYQITEKGMAGALLQTEFFKNKINPSITLSYNHRFNKLLNLTASYTIINNSYNNLGGGLIFQPGPIQFYVMADNILGTFQPQNAQHLQLRTGINLIIGKKKEVGDIKAKKENNEE